MEQDSELIEALAASLGRPLPSGSVERLVGYLDRIAHWSRRVDLTGASSPVDRAQVLLADALMLADEVHLPEGSRLVDVGSGNGAPIIPLLLLRPDLTALGVEPRRKRVAFLRSCLAPLGLLDALSILEARIDPRAPSLPDSPRDVALSRATFAPARWLSIGAALAPHVVVFGAAEPLPTPLQDMSLAATVSYRLPRGNPRQLGHYLRT